jgi:hypothetical protein
LHETKTGRILHYHNRRRNGTEKQTETDDGQNRGGNAPIDRRARKGEWQCIAGLSREGHARGRESPWNHKIIKTKEKDVENIEIKIDAAEVQRHVDAELGGIVAQAMKSYEVQKSLESAFAASATSGKLAAAISAAVELLDMDAMTSALAEQLARSYVAGAVHLLRSSVIKTMMDLEGLPTYDQAARTKRESELRAIFKQ